VNVLTGDMFEIVVQPPNIAQDMETILNNPKYSDITFVCEQKPIYAHKIVLYTTCREFEQYFVINQVELPEIKYKDFLTLLKWIYTGALTDIIEGVTDTEDLLRSLESTAQKLKLYTIAHSLEQFINYNDLVLLKKQEQDSLFLENGFAQQNYSDVTFFIEGNQLSAHKVILYARCSYFKKMFDSGMLESQQKQIQIPHEKYQTFSGLLQYIYSNRVDLRDDNVVDILCLANAYGMPRLVELCERFLQNNISENASELLSLAEHHQAKQLFEFCIDFCAKHWDKLPQKLKSKLSETYQNKIIFIYTCTIHNNKQFLQLSYSPAGND